MSRVFCLAGTYAAGRVLVRGSVFVIRRVVMVMVIPVGKSSFLILGGCGSERDDHADCAPRLRQFPTDDHPADRHSRIAVLPRGHVVMEPTHRTRRPADDRGVDTTVRFLASGITTSSMTTQRSSITYLTFVALVAIRILGWRCRAAGKVHGQRPLAQRGRLRESA